MRLPQILSHKPSMVLHSAFRSSNPASLMFGSMVSLSIIFQVGFAFRGFASLRALSAMPSFYSK